VVIRLTPRPLIQCIGELAPVVIFKYQRNIDLIAAYEIGELGIDNNSHRRDVRVL
jgi:hypothetical protein